MPASLSAPKRIVASGWVGRRSIRPCIDQLRDHGLDQPQRVAGVDCRATRPAEHGRGLDEDDAVDGALVGAGVEEGTERRLEPLPGSSNPAAAAAAFSTSA